jgi:hypothetical protein
MSRRVLVVEDEEDLRDIARFTLEGAGFEVIEAANGVEGVAKSEAGRPDLVRCMVRTKQRGPPGPLARFEPKVSKAAIIKGFRRDCDRNFLRIGGGPQGRPPSKGLRPQFPEDRGRPPFRRFPFGADSEGTATAIS